MIFSPERDTQAALRVFRANGGYAQEVVSIQNGLLKGRRIHATEDFGLVGTTEVTYANASGFASPRTRQIYLSPHLFVFSSIPPAPSSRQFTHAWQFNKSDHTSTQTVTCPLDNYLRSGMVVTSARALVDPGAARVSGNRMGFGAIPNTGRDFNPAAPAVGSSIPAEFSFDDSTGNLQVIELTGLSWTIGVGVLRVLYVNSGGGDALTDMFYGIELTVQDPGPRNY
jgi:hypothetical protein